MADHRDARYYNAISITGALLATVSAILFLFFFLLDVFGFHTNPYLGIITFVLLPGVFGAGLLLIPLGLWRERRRRLPEGTTPWPTLDFARPRVRRVAIIILAVTVVNVAIVALAAVESIEYVDSTAFCTGVCHTPMEPQAVAHRRSVHANISCTSCHVGTGASGFITAKIGGARRLAAVVRGSYDRPVPSPVRDLPMAVETCRTCHSPTRYFGDLVVTVPSFADDEAVSDTSTTLAMHIGGGGFEAAGPSGVHWHASPQNRIEFIATDSERDTIPWVRVTDGTGEVREYTVDGVTPEQLAAGEHRVMDCTDCHNRYGHGFAATPERAVDRALARGLLPRTLPFVRREALAALSQPYPDRATGEQQIADRLTSFYTREYADQVRAPDPRLAQAVAATRQAYGENVFPAMKVTWGSYPSNIGHMDSPGCFRCHDDLHKSRTSPPAAISQDCEMCHRIQ